MFLRIHAANRSGGQFLILFLVMFIWSFALIAVDIGLVNGRSRCSSDGGRQTILERVRHLGEDRSLEQVTGEALYAMNTRPTKMPRLNTIMTARSEGRTDYGKDEVEGLTDRYSPRV